MNEAINPQKALVPSYLEREEGYDLLEEGLTNNVITEPLFTTDVPEELLWETYLSNIPIGRRQYYNCNCCRRFIQKYGNLVTVGENGITVPKIWCFQIPDFFYPAIHSMIKLIEKSKITGVFYSSDKVWGQKFTGQWSHLSCQNRNVYNNKVLTADQKSAEKSQDYGILCHSLADYSKDVISQALRVLKADALSRSEKALGVAQWFFDLHCQIENCDRKLKNNIIWSAVANAPVGFCHVRSSVVSTLLDDIILGLPFEVISKKWSEKLNPLQYQRPTKEISNRSILVAEKLVEKLGCASALERRYAKISDIFSFLWVPKIILEKPKEGGIFGHLKSNTTKTIPIELPRTKITWNKFYRTVLVNANKIEINCPQVGSYYGLVTAKYEDSIPLLQWDGLGGLLRNPVSWYFYNGGSSSSEWGLNTGWNPVSMIFLKPSLWQSPEKFKHQGDGVFFAIEAAKDSRNTNICLFPEILKSEFREIRAVIEKYNRKGCIQDKDEANANGLAFNSTSPVTVRVTNDEGPCVYLIDRFD